MNEEKWFRCTSAEWKDLIQHLCPGYLRVKKRWRQLDKRQVGLGINGYVTSEPRSYVNCAVNAGLTNRSIRSLTIGDHKIIAGTEGGGAFISPL